MWGPFGISLAPQIQKSRTLSKVFRPFANTFVKASGHRQLGLKYDDLLIVERDDVAKAVDRLSPEESYDRAWRLRRASHQSVLHKDLPKDQWVKPEEDQRYLSPLVAEIVKDNEERAFWDTVEPIPVRK